jgi:hypothetical protein
MLSGLLDNLCLNRVKLLINHFPIRAPATRFTLRPQNHISTPGRQWMLTSPREWIHLLR